MKQCPPGKVLNPKTKRCVKANGAVGKKLTEESPKKTCPEDKILNPKTNRCVNKNGALGKKLAQEKKSAPKVLSKTVLLEDLKKTCNNDSDPISMDDFNDMTLEQLKSLVKIGKHAKKNCYVLENIYEVYKTAILSKKNPKDPMDPDHILTDDEINDINTKMKLNDPNYKLPVYISPKPYPNGYDLNIELIQLYGIDMFRIRVMFRNRIKHDLGLLPAWIEAHHSGSSDVTSGVIITNIRELWDKKLLMDNVETCCNVPLKRDFQYWQGHTWKSRFIDLSQKINDLLTR